MKHAKYMIVAIVIAAVMLVTACGAPPEPTATPDPAAQAALAEQRIELVSTTWEVESFGGADDSLAVLPDTKLTMNMMVERYAGYNGCNWFLGVYDIDGAELRFNTPAVTALLCEDEAVTTQAATYMSALVNIMRYELDGEKLVTYTVGDQQMATFVPAEPVPLEGTEWTAKFVNDGEQMSQASSYDIMVSALFENGKVTGSAGCNDYAADYVIDGHQITISNVTAPDLECEEPAGVNDIEAWYLAALSEATDYSELVASLVLTGAEGQDLVFFGNP